MSPSRAGRVTRSGSQPPPARAYRPPTGGTARAQRASEEFFGMIAALRNPRRSL